MVNFSLDFKDFMNLYEGLSKLSKRFLHYKETSEGIELYFYTKEGIVYECMVSRKAIISFGSSIGNTEEQSFKDFFNNYLVDAVPLVSDDSVEVVTFSKEFKKSAEEDLFDVSQPYQTFYIDLLNKWEDKVIRSIPELKKSNKGFTDFLSNLFNTVNTVAFLNVIRRYVKNGLNAGIEEVEEEQGVQIGFTGLFNDRLKALENQQLSGYKLPDGTVWPGIKGQTKKLQFNILKEVEEGVRGKESNAEIAKRLEKQFGLSKVSAERTARTESTRFINEGKFTSYKEIGLDGKVVKAVGDSKTSDLCMRLWKKYGDNPIPIDDLYLDDVTGQQFLMPPHHVSCRCIISARKLK